MDPVGHGFCATSKGSRSNALSPLPSKNMRRKGTGRGPASRLRRQDADLEIYLGELRKFPLLKAGEETDLAQQIEAHELSALRAAVESPWVVHELVLLKDKL